MPLAVLLHFHKCKFTVVPTKTWLVLHFYEPARQSHIHSSAPWKQDHLFGKRGNWGTGSMKWHLQRCITRNGKAGIWTQVGGEALNGPRLSSPRNALSCPFPGSQVEHPLYFPQRKREREKPEEVEEECSREPGPCSPCVSWFVAAGRPGALGQPAHPQSILCFDWQSPEEDWEKLPDHLK